MASRRRVLAAIATTATTPITTALAGCTPGRPPASGGITKVVYLTGFGVFGREAYAWVAQAKGYFDEVGLDVSIQPGAAGSKNLALVAAGRAQFAVIDYSGALVRGAAAEPGFRILAAINRSSVIALMALSGKRVTAPRDLVGRRVAQATGAVPKTLFPAYARLAGFEPGGVHWIETSPQQLPVLLAAGAVDAIGQFVMGEPAVRAAADGHPVTVLPYSDYLDDLYGNVLVTSSDLAAGQPDLVRRFSAALLRGLRYAVDHPEESARILHTAVATTDPETAAEELRLMKAYVGVSLPNRPLGSFDPVRVARGIALIQSLGLIPTAFTPEHLVDFAAVPAGSSPSA